MSTPVTGPLPQTGAGLLVKTLWALAHVNPGFSPQQILTVRVTPNQSVCEDHSRCVALYAQLLQQIRSVSGVSAVAATNALPLSGETPAIPAEMDDHLDSPEQLGPMLWAGAITPEYFSMMHVPLLVGRTFTEDDSENTELVVIVSAATAKRFWPGENQIGKHIRPVWGEQPWRTVVGVVGDVRLYKVATELPDWISGVTYMPYPQAVGIDKKLPSSMTLVVRTAGDPLAMAKPVHQTIQYVDPHQAVFGTTTVEQIVSDLEGDRHFALWLLGVFAGLAIVLAAAGRVA